jgi:hypothetical protein
MGNGAAVLSIVNLKFFVLLLKFLDGFLTA